MLNVLFYKRTFHECFQILVVLKPCFVYWQVIPFHTNNIDFMEQLKIPTRPPSFLGLTHCYKDTFPGHLPP